MPGPAGAGHQLAFEIFRGPCPVTSCGQGCRYYADHDPVPHTFGGGLCDPVSNGHCGTPDQHPPHAWQGPKGFKGDMYNCSGRGLSG